MSCILSSGYNRIKCKSISGVKEVFISDYEETQTITIVNDIVTNISGFYTTYFEFDQRVQTASFTEPDSTSVENNTQFYTQTLVLKINLSGDQNIDQLVKNRINTLTKGEFRAVVLSNDDTYYLLGYDTPLHCTAMTGGLGKTYADGQSYELTFTSLSKKPAYKIDSAAILPLVIYNGLTTDTHQVGSYELISAGSHIYNGTYNDNNIAGNTINLVITNNSVSSFTIVSSDTNNYLNDIHTLDIISLTPKGDIYYVNLNEGNDGWSPNGTFNNINLTEGSGSGAKATITISGGEITDVNITSPGINYMDGDILIIDAQGPISSTSGYNSYIPVIYNIDSPTFKVKSTIWTN
jgi:hypothetical protein